MVFMLPLKDPPYVVAGRPRGAGGRARGLRPARPISPRPTRCARPNSSHHVSRHAGPTTPTTASASPRSRHLARQAATSTPRSGPKADQYRRRSAAGQPDQVRGPVGRDPQRRDAAGALPRTLEQPGCSRWSAPSSPPSASPSSRQVEAHARGAVWQNPLGFVTEATRIDAETPRRQHREG